MKLPLLSSELREPAECIVLVDDEPIADLYPFLMEVTVEVSRTAAAVGTLKFETRREADGGWPVLDSDVLVPWKPIRIEAAFGSHTEEALRGFIREIKAEYPAEPGASTVTVECQDESIALDREHVRQVWGGDAPTDDSVILQTILARHGLAPHPDSAAGLGGLTLNQDATDIAFLMQRAAANGFELIFMEGAAYFGPMRLDTEPQETILVYAGRDANCVRFAASASGDTPDSVAYDVAADEGAESVEEVVGPDLPLLGREPASSAGSGLADATWRMVRQGGGTDEELASRARQKANELAMKVRAEGELDGTMYGHVLRVGETVPVDGVGDRLGGLYYVDAVTHRFDQTGYRQSFTLLRNAYGDTTQPSSSPLAGVI